MNLQRPTRTYDYDNAVITYVCEYGVHGKWGPATQPAVYLVGVLCPYCAGSNFELFMCWPCWSADRVICCTECRGEMLPGEAWTVKAQWFS